MSVCPHLPHICITQSNNALKLARESQTPALIWPLAEHSAGSRFAPYWQHTNPLAVERLTQVSSVLTVNHNLLLGSLPSSDVQAGLRSALPGM